MRAIEVDFYGQNGQHEGLYLDSSWEASPAIKVGVWSYDSSLTIWNALAGAGELFLDRIEITFDGPVQGVLSRANWHVNPSRPNVLVIGAGHEYMAPQSNLNVRWGYSHRAPTSLRYGPATFQFTPAMKRDIFTPLAHSLLAPRPTGMWAPFNPSDMDPGAPGGEGIAAVAGWEQDGAGFLLRHDMMMDRAAIGYLDATTGAPVIAPQSSYTTDRGWSKATQLEVFTNPVHGMYDDSRSPLVTWAGTSPYRDVMLGKASRQHSYLPPDKQHLARLSMRVRAAAQCADPAAQMSLAMIAANCASGRLDVGSLPPGTRDRAWTIDALASWRTTFSKARALIDGNVSAQTPSGSIMRASYGYPFSPSPWTVSETIPVPIPQDQDVDAVGIERMISCHALGLDNRTETIKRAMDGAPWPCPKFVAVAQQNGQPFAHFGQAVGHAGWDVWIALGAAAVLGVEGWETHAIQYPTPGGRLCHSLKELRDTLRAETVGNDQSVGVLCVLEQMRL